MENIRNHKNIKLVTTYEKLNEYTSEPNMMNVKCFSEDLLVVEMRKTEVMMNKTVYLGQSILDTSKTLMYEFYYDYLKKKYDNDVKLCYTDTDSFIIHVKTDDFYLDISAVVNKRFDTRSYSKNTNRPIEVGVNEQILGMMKGELGDDEMDESVNAGAKLYSYTRQTPNSEIKEAKKANSTKKCIKKQCFRHRDFKDAVLNNKIIRCTQRGFRSYNYWVLVLMMINAYGYMVIQI